MLASRRGMPERQTRARPDPECVTRRRGHGARAVSFRSVEVSVDSMTFAARKHRGGTSRRLGSLDDQYPGRF